MLYLYKDTSTRWVLRQRVKSIIETTSLWCLFGAGIIIHCGAAFTTSQIISKETTLNHEHTASAANRNFGAKVDSGQGVTTSMSKPKPKFNAGVRLTGVLTTAEATRTFLTTTTNHSMQYHLILWLLSINYHYDKRKMWGTILKIYDFDLHSSKPTEDIADRSIAEV
jgi:hypothetical protein